MYLRKNFPNYSNDYSQFIIENMVFWGVLGIAKIFFSPYKFSIIWSSKVHKLLFPFSCIFFKSSWNFFACVFDLPEIKTCNEMNLMSLCQSLSQPWAATVSLYFTWLESCERFFSSKFPNGERPTCSLFESLLGLRSYFVSRAMAAVFVLFVWAFYPSVSLGSFLNSQIVPSIFPHFDFIFVGGISSYQ